MGAEEGEHADEEGGHEDEHRIEGGVIFPVEGVGVGLVLDEAGIGVGVAGLAGGEDILFGQSGFCVGGWEDVVVAVAIEAGGDIGGDVGSAEGHGFAVVGFAVVFEAIFVAFTAAGVAEFFEVAVMVGGFDFVGRVAIGADGAFGVALNEELAMYAVIVDFLDLDVALAAGLADVGVVDGGAFVVAGDDIVDSVAVVAGGGDDEAHFQEAASVDAIEVLFGGVGGFDAVFVREVMVAVTFGTGVGEVEFKDGGIGVLDGDDVVGAVAIGASGGGGSTHLVAYAMDAFVVDVDDILVAVGAADFG